MNSMEENIIFRVSQTGKTMFYNACSVNGDCPSKTIRRFLSAYVNQTREKQAISDQYKSPSVEKVENVSGYVFNPNTGIWSI